MLVIKDLSKLVGPLSCQKSFQKSGDELNFHNSQYKVLNRIFKGPFSSVYKMMASDGELVALKLESKDGYRSMRTSLKMDITVLRAVAGKRGFVDLKDVARNADWKAVVMKYVGPDLQRLQLTMPEKKFSLPTAYHIALETLDRLETLHQAGYLHRDLKQANFAVGFGEDTRCVYMLDFGMARRYINSEGQISLRKKGPMCGTIPFASMAAHCMEDLGPKDDLENWLYMCLHMIIGSLPWYKSDEEGPHFGETSLFMTWDWKQWALEVERSCLFDGINAKWQKVQQVISNCPRNHTAPFGLVRGLLRKILEEDGIDIEQPLDWEKQASLKQEIAHAASKNNLFREI